MNTQAGTAFELLKCKTAKLPPVRCSEIVLQTTNYDLMREWYEAVLGLPWGVTNLNRAAQRVLFPGSPKQVRASDVRSCFMFLDPDIHTGQVLALFEAPWVAAAPSSDPGLNHLQFKVADLEALMTRAEALVAAQILPHRASNHGPLTSYYFCDPDFNVVEFAVNNFEDAAAFNAFVRSDEFRSNPSGVELDPEDFIRRFRSGEPKENLLRFG